MSELEIQKIKNDAMQEVLMLYYGKIFYNKDWDREKILDVMESDMQFLGMEDALNQAKQELNSNQ